MDRTPKNQSDVRCEAIEAVGGRAAASAPPESTGEIRKGKLAGLSLPAAIWVLSWPILTESFLQSLVGLVDTVLAAGISEAATAAIGGAAYIIWALTLIGFSVGIGATAMISRSLGRGRQAVANAAVGQALLIAFLSGIVMGTALALLTGSIADWLNLSDEATAEIKPYLWILAGNTPMVSVVVAGIACQRGAGDSKRPLLTMVILNLINISVSWWASGVDVNNPLPFGPERIINPSPYDLGTWGIALGTFVAYTYGAVLTIFWLSRGTSGVRLRAKRLRPHWHTMRRLIKVGLPNFLESLGMWAGNFLVLLFVGWLALGDLKELMGAHVIAIRIEAFSFMPGFAMGIAAGTLAGQYLGAGNVAKARRAILVCSGVSALLMGLFGVAFLTLNSEIVGKFSQQPLHLEQTPRLIFICGFIQIPFGIMLVIRNALRGAGDTRAVMIITWVSTFLIRLPLAWFFSGVDIPLPWGDGLTIPNPGPDWGLWGLWIGLCSELALRSVFFIGRFLQGGWQKVKV